MAMTLTMNKILTKPALILLALAVPATASAQPTLEGRWANPHHSVIVKVGQIRLPAMRVRSRPLFALDAEKLGRHAEDERAGRRSR